MNDGSKKVMKSTRGKKKKASSDVSVRKKKAPGSAVADEKKKTAAMEASTRSKRVRKKTKGADVSVRKSREKAAATTKMGDTPTLAQGPGQGQPPAPVAVEEPDEAEMVCRVWGRMEEKITPPGYMNAYQATDEQKAAFVKFAKATFAQGVDGLLKEFAEQLKPYIGGPFQRVIFDQNRLKNRYTDVICNDLTRVVVADGRGSDYIHANYVRGEPLFNEFVCTQGPTPATLNDFWRMILHIRAFNIVMLCETVEQGKTKCEQYWPTTKGEKMTFGDITVESVDSVDTDKTQTRLSILSVTCGTDKHTLIHHHWKAWPDRSIPKSGKGALRILRSIRYSTKPTVVHCSAGVGRTGTLVCIEMCLQRLLSTLQLDLISVCKRLRDQRMHVLQVDTQYVYLALVVIEFGRACGYLSYPELEQDFEKFRAELVVILGKRDINGQPIPEPAGGGGGGGAAAAEQKTIKRG